VRDDYHGYKKAGVNRVRREPAVGSAINTNSRSNSRSKLYDNENTKKVG
jgi:hypothetical protein